MFPARGSSYNFATWVTLAAILAAVPVGCSSWKRQQAGPATILAREEPPRRIRLILADSSAVEVTNPAVRGDSVVGILRVTVNRNGYWREVRRGEGAVALADIRGAELRKGDIGKTILFVAAGVGATVLVVAIAAGSGSSGGSSGGGGGGGSGGGSGDPGCQWCSCPLVFSHDGQRWVLDSGTFGGAFLRPLAYTDYDVLEALEPQGGELRVRLQAGDRETDTIDDFAILAVDHDASLTVATDPSGGIRTIAAPVAATSARDSRGRDALPSILVSDGRSWESALAVRDTALANDVRETLTLEFPRPEDAGSARLVLRANKTAWAAHLMRSFVAAHGTATSKWFDTMDADPSLVSSFRKTLEEEVHLNVFVQERNGWVRQSSVWGGGPEIPKTHVIPLDLSRTTAGSIRVRLEMAPSFWLVDWAALDSGPEPPFVVREVPLRSAIASNGHAAASALRERDGDELILRTGDMVDMTFEETPLPGGLARTYLSRTSGWYRFHAPETGPPDTALLAYLLREPRGISKMSISWVNAALRSVASAN